ncbi:hypothetical protein VP01_5101g1 [Puccinia sorghi]|uniref:Uncharacterized protein n=1 Tax=Puccinia sorghi TaxID=27349 RepID=A0A0L6UL95_9BASI|nr:hypothetical protein VP01_5101g1 [Puccinia sorghi]
MPVKEEPVLNRSVRVRCSPDPLVPSCRSRQQFLHLSRFHKEERAGQLRQLLLHSPRIHIIFLNLSNNKQTERKMQIEDVQKKLFTSENYEWFVQAFCNLHGSSLLFFLVCDCILVKGFFLQPSFKIVLVEFPSFSPSFKLNPNSYCCVLVTYQEQIPASMLPLSLSLHQANINKFCFLKNFNLYFSFCLLIVTWIKILFHSNHRINYYFSNLMNHAKTFIMYEVVNDFLPSLKISLYFFLLPWIFPNSKISSQIYQISYFMQFTSNNFHKKSKIQISCRKLSNLSTPSFLFSLNLYRDTKWISSNYHPEYIHVFIDTFREVLSMIVGIISSKFFFKFASSKVEDLNNLIQNSILSSKIIMIYFLSN